jgi:RNA polymerase sigma-70 factor (ECF subfamily)
MMGNKTIENVCEEKVFNEIFKSISKDLHDFLYYKFGENNNPQDIVQLAFEKLWKNCKNILPEKAKSFLFTVANNEMLNSISRKKTVLNYRLQDPKNYTVESPEYLLEEKEYHERLKKALEELSEEQRVTFLLNRVEGKKHQEIADILGISRKAVEKRIYTALKILRQKVEIDKFKKVW